MATRKRLTELHIELGNAITAIKVSTELLLRQNTTTDAQRKHLQTVATQADRAWSLVREFLVRGEVDAMIDASERPAVFIIDDHAEHREALELVVDDEGYLPVSCGSAEEALQRLEERGTPEIMLVDRQLPGRSGEELVQLLRERGITCPVIVISGLGAEPLAGAEATLAKPVDVELLITLLRRLAPIRGASER